MKMSDYPASWSKSTRSKGHHKQEIKFLFNYIVQATFDNLSDPFIGLVLFFIHPFYKEAS